MLLYTGERLGGERGGDPTRDRTGVLSKSPGGLRRRVGVGLREYKERLGVRLRDEDERRRLRRLRYEASELEELLERLRCLRERR